MINLFIFLIKIRENILWHALKRVLIKIVIHITKRSNSVRAGKFPCLEGVMQEERKICQKISEEIF
jgi:hypothetical protein